MRPDLLPRRHWTEAWPDLFREGPIHVARAPGRLDVMGGIADYSGSMVFELPLACGTWVALQPRSDGRFELRSHCKDGAEQHFTASFTHDELVAHETPHSDKRLANAFETNPKQRWAAYALGPILHAARKLNVAIEDGLSLAIDSDVPLAAGVSSSASLEVASLTAALSLWGMTLDGLKIAALCQEAENHIARAPCGIMDQVTCTLGKENLFLAILCQPHMIVGHYAIPDQVAYFGIHTGVKHSVGGSRYSDARVGAFMGQRIISWHATEGDRGPDRYGGYLANVNSLEYHEEYRALLPERMRGADFIKQYNQTVDAATHIDPDREYAVRLPTEHPIFENERVFQYLVLMTEGWGGARPDLYEEAGELMYQSHASYGERCGLGCAEADWIVNRVRELGPGGGFYGAKITGGGAGGTVAIMARADALDAVYRVAADYQASSGNRALVLQDSSPGAEEMGVEVL